MADELDLGVSDIALQVPFDDAAHRRRPALTDLARRGLLLLELGVFLADLGEGAVEDGQVFLKRELDPVVLLEGGLPRGVPVAGLQGNRLVAVLLGKLDAAVPVVVLHVGPAENDQAGFQLFLVGNERHFAPHSHSVQVPCRSAA